MHHENYNNNKFCFLTEDQLYFQKGTTSHNMKEMNAITQSKKNVKSNIIPDKNDSIGFFYLKWKIYSKFEYLYQYGFSVNFLKNIFQENQNIRKKYFDKCEINVFQVPHYPVQEFKLLTLSTSRIL